MNRIFKIICLLVLFSCNQNPDQAEPGAESISPDTLIASGSIFKEHAGNCSSPEQLCCMILIEYPVFSGNANADPINNIIHSFFSSAMGVPTAKTIDEAWKKTSGFFVEQSEKYPDLTVNWTYEGTGSISYRTENFISITLSMYSYEGGAHPNTMVEMFSFDLNRSKRLMPGDVFINEKEITEIAEKQFRKEKNISKEQSLADAGFDIEEFYLPHNFLLTDKEIIFYYNTYEIAPYVEGPTELHIPYDDISHLLKQEFGKI